MKEKRKIFVIMPFVESPSRNQLQLTSFFENNIKKAIESSEEFEYQYVVERSDDAFDITDQIVRDIFQADIVICDLSGKKANPNVMYELGIRFSISPNPVILIREDSGDDHKIFDVAHFHTEMYSPLDYPSIENHIIKMIGKYERGERLWKSPVHKILETEPSIINQINKKKVLALLESMHSSFYGLRKSLGLALNEYFEIHDVDFKFENPRRLSEELSGFMNDDYQLDWGDFKYSPNIPPSIAAYLNEFPLDEYVPEKVFKEFNTALVSFFNDYFISNHMWSPVSLPAIYNFAGECHHIANAIAGIIVMVREPGDIDLDDIQNQVSEFLELFNSED